MSLKSANLLTKFKSSETQQLFKNIKFRYKIMGLEILLAPRSLKEYSRILISIPKKAGNSPQRNKFRRRVKAIFYEEKLFESKFDWIVLARRKEVVALDFNTIKKIFTNVAKKSS